ncbi:MAG: kynureninase [Enterobacterales bacterium]|jgi:kynureninase
MAVLTTEHFEELDKVDPLSSCRELFDLPSNTIYADGNSLGAMPKAAMACAEQVVKVEWGNQLIRSWVSSDWINASTRIGNKIAPLIGAEGSEVLVCDTTSINIFKLAAAAMELKSGRCKIISEVGNFPTDLYMLQGLERFSNGRVELVVLPKEDILDAIDENTALVVLTHVHYKTSFRFDMKAVTAQVHEKGALMLWDLSHSVGAMHVSLNEYAVDFAVGCGYKYLNGGPGAPAFLFVAERHQKNIQSPLSGWLGHSSPFAFVDDYQPADDIKRMLCGTPSVVACALLEVGVDIMTSVDMQLIREKSIQLGDLFIQLVEQRCPEFTLISPKDASIRGSHISIVHKEGYAIMQALIAENIIGDFRAPNVLRFGITPLYMSYLDIWNLVQALVDVMAFEKWNEEEFKTVQAVT